MPQENGRSTANTLSEHSLRVSPSSIVRTPATTRRSSYGPQRTTRGRNHRSGPYQDRLPPQFPSDFQVVYHQTPGQLPSNENVPPQSQTPNDTTTPLYESERQRSLRLQYKQQRQDTARAIFKILVADFRDKIEFKFLKNVIEGAMTYAPPNYQPGLTETKLTKLPNECLDEVEVVDFSFTWFSEFLVNIQQRRMAKHNRCLQLQQEATRNMHQTAMPNVLTDSNTGLITVDECLQLSKAFQALRSWFLQVNGIRPQPYFQEMITYGFWKYATYFVSSFGRFESQATEYPTTDQLLRVQNVAWPDIHPQVEPTTDRKRAWEALIGPDAMGTKVKVLDTAVMNIWIVAVWRNVGKHWVVGSGLVSEEDLALQENWLTFAAWPEHTQPGPWDMWSRKYSVATERNQCPGTLEAAGKLLMSWSTKYIVRRQALQK